MEGEMKLINWLKKTFTPTEIILLIIIAVIVGLLLCGCEKKKSRGYEIFSVPASEDIDMYDNLSICGANERR